MPPEVHAGACAAGVESVDAGEFGAWLEDILAALSGRGESRVPCGDCVGCCTSGYSLQLRSHEHAALANVPAMLLVEAEGFPRGEKTLPPLPDGRCPMLIERRCSIYAQRPGTCRDYDCRVFAAAGLEAGGADKAAINRRIRAWRFRYANPAARAAHAAIRATARFLREHRSAFERIGVRVPASSMGIAVYALQAHVALLDPAAGERDEIAQARAFDAAMHARLARTLEPRELPRSQ